MSRQLSYRETMGEDEQSAENSVKVRRTHSLPSDAASTTTMNETCQGARYCSTSRFDQTYLRIMTSKIVEEPRKLGFIARGLGPFAGNNFNSAYSIKLLVFWIARTMCKGKLLLLRVIFTCNS